MFLTVNMSAMVSLPRDRGYYTDSEAEFGIPVLGTVQRRKDSVRKIPIDNNIEAIKSLIRER